MIVKQEVLKLQETAICRLCLEPVSNYICIECLFRNISSWLHSKNKGELLANISEKHESLKKMLHSDFNGTFCVVCKEKITEIACPCCYLYEMFHLIRALEPEFSEEFEIFNFDFKFHHGYSQFTLWQSLHEQVSTRNFQPIIINDKINGSDTNFCDSCGQSSDDIREANGSWLCESCREGQ